jgi:hypothetical protein
MGGVTAHVSRTVIHGLSAGGAVLTSQADIASTIAPSSTVCSSDNYDPLKQRRDLDPQFYSSCRGSL